MTQQTKIGKAAGGVLLLLVASALPAMAATNSDFNGIMVDPQFGFRDWCTAVDADGMHTPNEAQGEDSSCDSGGRTPPSGDNSGDTSTTSSYNGGVLTGCNNFGGGVAHCEGGFIFNADQASAFGNFDSDFPKANQVVIKSVATAGPFVTTGFNVRTVYMTDQGVVANTNPEDPICLDGVVDAFEIAPFSFSVDVGGADPWDTPAGTDTIAQVVGFRAPVGGAACGLPASASVRTVTGDWTYAAVQDVTDTDGDGEGDNDSDSNAATSYADVGIAVGVFDPVALTCPLTWFFEAGGDGTGFPGAGGVPTANYGQAYGELNVDGDVFIVSETSGPAVGTAAVPAGPGAYVYEDQTMHAGVFDFLSPGEWAGIAAESWQVGSAWAVATAGAYPAPAVGFQCVPGVPTIPPEVPVNPICSSKALYAEAAGAGMEWTAIGLCIDLNNPLLVFICDSVVLGAGTTLGAARYATHQTIRCQPNATGGCYVSTVFVVAINVVAADTTTEVYCSAAAGAPANPGDLIASASTAAIGFQVAFGQGVKPTPAVYTCEFHFAPDATPAGLGVSSHAGVCIG